MKKIFIIIISFVVLVIGVYYLAANNSAAKSSQPTNVTATPGYSGSQAKNYMALPPLRQNPSTRTS